MSIQQYSSWPKPIAAATRPTHVRTRPTVWQPAGELSTSRCLAPGAEADPTSRLMTLEDLAQFLAVSPRWVYDNHRSLGMPALRIERTLRFRRTQIDAWLDTRSTPPDAATRGVRA